MESKWETHDVLRLLQILVDSAPPHSEVLDDHLLETTDQRLIIHFMTTFEETWYKQVSGYMIMVGGGMRSSSTRSACPPRILNLVLTVSLPSKLDTEYVPFSSRFHISILCTRPRITSYAVQRTLNPA